jgi:hypothetical protein
MHLGEETSPALIDYLVVARILTNPGGSPLDHTTRSSKVMMPVGLRRIRARTRCINLGDAAVDLAIAQLAVVVAM